MAKCEGDASLQCADVLCRKCPALQGLRAARQPLDVLKGLLLLQRSGIMSVQHRASKYYSRTVAPLDLRSLVRRREIVKTLNTQQPQGGMQPCRAMGGTRVTGDWNENARVLGSKSVEELKSALAYNDLASALNSRRLCGGGIIQPFSSIVRWDQDWDSGRAIGAQDVEASLHQLLEQGSRVRFSVSHRPSITWDTCVVGQVGNEGGGLAEPQDPGRHCAGWLARNRAVSPVSQIPMG